jgi:hypothetical protein
MTTKLLAYLVACTTALSGFPATAATVIPYEGDVFVSRGKGFEKINGAATVKVGDSVMVGRNGAAQVRLDDGNTIMVSPGRVLTVPAKAVGRDATLPPGAYPTQATLPSGASPTAADPGGIDGLIGAGILAAGAAAIAAALATSGDNGSPVIIRPASP